jgi:hydrogenase/urease accessory protein HupE
VIDDMRPRALRAAVSALLLCMAVPAAAHDMTVGGSRWFLGRDGIIATIDVDASLIGRIQGLDEARLDLDARSEAQLAQFTKDVLQPYVDRKLEVEIGGSRRPAHVDRLVKAGPWQIWVSVDHVRPAGIAEELRVDYRMFLEETNGSHVNLAYLYLSQEGRESAQRTFDFTQPTWQSAFEVGATTWKTTLPPAPGEPVASSRSSSAPARSSTKKSARATASTVPAVPPAVPASPANATRTTSPDEASVQTPVTAVAPPSSIWSQIARFLLLGIEHILTGYDHIAFLLALVVVAPSLRAVLPIITAFTAAHSITLLLAAMHIVSLPSRIVESAIAISICYVAAENLFREKATHRWLVTFCFGLIHGFGFASALQDLIVGRTNLVVSVVSFNIGVELGQLLIFALMLPVLRALARIVQARNVIVATSAAIGLLGCTWVVERGLDVKLLPFL